MILTAACVLAAAPVFAADTAKPAATTAAAPAAAPAATNSQQEKMKACNAKAEGKTGDDRKKFMSECLSSKPPAKPESKIAMCNKKTAGLSGEARSKAQSECMKGPT